ncbi:MULTISPECIES: hypothetical protein [unclassified Polynucleobacter]|jgi:hypothetical protein|uniref:hypothetical protein n=1 Tax=unclassified Polynucleobacter TaxID=2640945 RepID=UPI00092B380A|nr:MULTISPECIES: hypothetical protein [unclassified Polynucleobacter]MBU3563773.1 hypothetical protein [Polynucleobacter sp. Tro8-14-1]OJI05533.1 hypothetical protein AOC28_00920 [Polynucleobacter sp. MWH-Adler-W8]
MNKILLACAGMSLVFLAGCASKPPALVESAYIGQVPADPPKNPVISAEALKADSKSIAVTDIYFKKEGKNLTFVEETRTTTDSNISSAIAPKTIEVDADKANASAIAGGANSSAFPVKFTNLADPTATSPGVAAAPVTDTAAPSNSSSSANTQSMKKSGYQANNEYGELRYLANPIRGLLIKSGYKVVQAKAAVAAPNQGDEYFDIVKRIKAGDFGDADYVLYGVLAEVSSTDNVSDIPGTKSTSQQMTLEVTVDFNIVDTKTTQIVASFVASGEGKDVQIDGRDTGYKPSNAKLMKLASLDLAEDVRKHLADQNFITNNPGSAGQLRNLKTRLNDDASTLKVYK